MMDQISNNNTTFIQTPPQEYRQEQYDEEYDDNINDDE